MVLEGTENGNSTKSNPQTPLFKGAVACINDFSE